MMKLIAALIALAGLVAVALLMDQPTCIVRVVDAKGIGDCR